MRYLITEMLVIPPFSRFFGAFLAASRSISSFLVSGVMQGVEVLSNLLVFRDAGSLRSFVVTAIRM